MGGGNEFESGFEVDCDDLVLLLIRLSKQGFGVSEILTQESEWLISPAELVQLARGGQGRSDEMCTVLS